MSVEIIQGNCREVLKALPDKSVHCVVTSPPYWGLRDYGTDGQLGLEATPEQYVENLVAVFREVRRVLRDDGTLWLNLGDCYNAGRNGGWAGGKGALNEGRDIDTIYQSRSGPNAPGLKPKDLAGIPWMVAFALRADGWWLRSDIIWSKPNPMPESVRDRPTKAHEYMFLLSKSKAYYYDADAIREPSVSPEQEAHNQRYANVYDGPSTHPDNGQPGNVNNGGIHSRPGPGGRNKRSVWEIATQPFPGAHFATFPEALVKPCIQAGCPEGGTVLDPFAGAGTVGVVARKAGRSAILIELSESYCEMMRERLDGSRLPMLDQAVAIR